MRFLIPFALLAGLVAAAPATGARRPTLAIAPSTEQLASGELRFTVSTDATLGGSGGLYVELRGVDLAQMPRHSFAKPDVTETGCVSSPCHFYVGRPAGSRYQFRAFLIDSRSRAAVAQSTPVRLSWPSLPLTGLTFLLNGKPRPLSEVFVGQDEYVPVAARTLDVEARWKPLPGRSGFTVVLSTAEPKQQEYARCTAGTSCRVRQSVPLTPREEMSWVVEIRRKDGGVIDRYQYCLAGA